MCKLKDEILDVYDWFTECMQDYDYEYENRIVNSYGLFDEGISCDFCGSFDIEMKSIKKGLYLIVEYYCNNCGIIFIKEK